MIIDKKLIPFACVLHIKNENRDRLKYSNEYYSGDNKKVNESFKNRIKLIIDPFRVNYN